MLQVTRAKGGIIQRTQVAWTARRDIASSFCSLSLPSTTQSNASIKAPCRNNQRHYQTQSTVAMQRGSINTLSLPKPLLSSVCFRDYAAVTVTIQRLFHTDPKRNFLEDKALNQKIIQAKTASELLKFLQSLPGALTSPASEGVLNNVNLSTSIYRLAKHSLTDTTVRASIIADPCFALLLSATAEMLLTPRDLDPRQCSNVAWALAKLKCVPSSSDLLVADDTHEALQDAATVVRQAVVQAGQHHGKGRVDPSMWTPHVATLSGRILDHIGTIVQATLATPTITVNNNSKSFQQQGLSNLLWAWATAGRAYAQAFAQVSERMRLVQQQSNEDSMPPQPQAWINALWAFATARVYHGQEELLRYVATMFRDHPDFVQQCEPQHMSNMVRLQCMAHSVYCIMYTVLVVVNIS
jgi:hypothetical protein